MKKEYELLDIKYIGENVVFLVKDVDIYIVSDNQNAHFPYKNLEVVVIEKDNGMYIVIDKHLTCNNNYYNLKSAELYFNARCNYLENRLEMIKKLALKKLKDSLEILEIPKNKMTDITFGDIKKVVCSNNYYEVVIDYKINDINNFSIVKVYESELLEYGDEDKDIEVEYIIY